METDKSESDKTEAESSDDEKYEPPIKTTRKYRKKRASIAWLFCDRQNDMIASCKICQQKMSYRTTVTNLTKHARSKHPEFYREVMEKAKSGTLPEGSLQDSWIKYKLNKRHREKNLNDFYEEIGSDDSIWKFFTLLDKSLKIASCKICNKRMDYSTQLDLLHHIKKKHNDQYIPDKNITLIVTDDDQLFEVENIEKIETLDNTLEEADHLQDVTNDEYVSPIVSEDYTSPKKRVQFQSTQKINKLRRNRPITIIEKSNAVPETTLDYFGKYLISLLKELPEHVSNKLQADFVRQVFEAKNTAPICAKISIVPQAVPSFKIPYNNETEVINECDQ